MLQQFYLEKLSDVRVTKMMSNIEHCYHLPWQKISAYTLYLKATSPDVSDPSLQGSIWEAKDKVRLQANEQHETMIVNDTADSISIKDLNDLIESRFSQNNKLCYVDNKDSKKSQKNINLNIGN